MNKINYDLNGGKIPSLLDEPEQNIRKKIFPIIYSDSNIYVNNNIVINNKSASSHNLNLNYIFEMSSSTPTEIQSDQIILFADKIININSTNIIPFHACLINSKFNIIKKFYNLLTSTYIDNTIVPYEDIEFAKKIFKDFFILHRETLDFISLSARMNILNKIIFANKLRELLKLLYDFSDKAEINDDEITCSYLKIFGINSIFENNDQVNSYVNFSDLMKLFDEYTKIDRIEVKNHLKVELNDEQLNEKINQLLLRKKPYTETNEFTLKQHIDSDIFEIKKLIRFIRILDKLDLMMAPNNIKLSQLFFACIINYRLYHSSLNIGYLSSKLYPINIKSFIENLINESINLDEIIFDSESLNYKLYEGSKYLPSYHTYSQSFYIEGSNNYGFPDCVENTLLQFIKTICWNYKTKTFDKDLLSSNTIIPLKNFIDKLNTDNDNSLEIKNEFTSIVSNIPTLSNIYKNNNKYEIKSDIDNFFKVLNYLFPDVSLKNIIKKSKIIKSIEESDSNIILKAKDKSKIIFSIKSGHSSHYVLLKQKPDFDSYIYHNLIILLTSNYSFLSLISIDIIKKLVKILPIKSINFDRKYINITNFILDYKLYLLDLYDEDGDWHFNDVNDMVYDKKFTQYLNLLSPNDLLSFFVNSYYLNNLANSLIEEIFDDSFSLKSNKYKYFSLIVELFDKSNILEHNFSLYGEEEKLESMVPPRKVSRNIIYYLVLYFWKVGQKNVDKVSNPIIFCNFINKLINPFLQKMDFNTIKKILFTRNIKNNLYDTVVTLPDEYIQYFNKFIDPKYLSKIRPQPFSDFN